MKIIDLLNKIANDELEDTKFFYDGDYFKYCKHSKQIDRYEDNSYNTVEYYNEDELFPISVLNDEVEIIDKIKNLDINITTEQQLTINGKVIYKINELIDEVNKLQESDK